LSTLDKMTLGIAVIGLLLSIWNTWRLHIRDKIIIRVVPKISYPVGPWNDPRPRFGFEIINESVFPVTVTEVGFEYRGTQQRGALPRPLLLDNGDWPRRLDPRTSLTAYSDPVEALDLQLSDICCAYVTTATGKSFRGISKALEQVVRGGTIPRPRRAISRSGTSGILDVKDFTEVA
jgi:hypothetical protein